MTEHNAENGPPGTCPKCGSQTPIGHRCIVDDLAAIRDADLSDHPLMQAIKGAAPAESDPIMRAFVAGWFAHARNPQRLVVEDAWRAYQRVLPPGDGRAND